MHTWSYINMAIAGGLLAISIILTQGEAVLSGVNLTFLVICLALLTGSSIMLYRLRERRRK